MNQGKFVITAMVAIGMAMAVFAWWARYTASQRILERFGPKVAVAVRNAEGVELLSISDEVGDIDVAGTENLPETISMSLGDMETVVYVTGRQDISKSAGLIHARHHLLHQKGYEWEDSGPPAISDRNWSVGLRFTHGDDVATWLLDFTAKRAYIVEQKTEIGMSPIAGSLQTFIESL